jgi:predicted enzyme related to lactoylglutathione lyase
MKPHEHHRTIDYIEFAATDLEATKSFYGSVFGWRFTDYGPDYTSFDDGRLTGGFEKTDAVAPGGPLVVIYSSDLESLERAIPVAGGVITRPTFEFPGGRRFHFRDPGGNELAVWSE